MKVKPKETFQTIWYNLMVLAWSKASNYFEKRINNCIFHETKGWAILWAIGFAYAKHNTEKWLEIERWMEQLEIILK